MSRSLRQRWPSPEVTGSAVRCPAKRERSQISSGARAGEFMSRGVVQPVFYAADGRTDDARAEIAFGSGASYPIGGRNRLAAVRVYPGIAGGRTPGACVFNHEENRDEDSLCCTVWCAHARERVCVCFSLPRRDEEDRCGDGEAPEVELEAVVRCEEIPRRRRNAPQGRQAPGIARRTGQGGEDTRHLKR